jgi:hypothetical protein
LDKIVASNDASSKAAVTVTERNSRTTVNKDLEKNIFVNNQLNAQFFFMHDYFYSLHVSGSHVPFIREIICINTASGISHSVQMTVWCADLHPQ